MATVTRRNPALFSLIFITLYSGIIPVIKIDLIKISNGQIGRLTRFIQKIYEKKIND